MLCAASFLGEHDALANPPACRESFAPTDAVNEVIQLSLKNALVFNIGSTDSARRTFRIDDQMFEIRIVAQLGEKSLPDALLGPSSETSEHAVPLAELFGQVAPRRAGTDQPQDGIDEQTIVCAVATLVAVNARRITIALPSCDLESHSRVGRIPL